MGGRLQPHKSVTAMVGVYLLLLRLAVSVNVKRVLASFRQELYQL